MDGQTLLGGPGLELGSEALFEILDHEADDALGRSLLGK